MDTKEIKWYQSQVYKDVKYAIIQSCGKKGLLRNDGEIILNPIFEMLYYSQDSSIFGSGCVFTVDSYSEVYPDTYGEGSLGRFSGEDFSLSFIDKNNETTLLLDNIKANKILEGYKDGFAKLRARGDLYGYDIVTINKKGEIVNKQYVSKPRLVSCGISHEHLNTDNYELAELELYVTDAEQEYRDAFDDDPGAEANVL